VNEARSTNIEWNKFEKAFGDFFKTVLRLGKANTKLTGNKTDEKIFIKNFNRDVGKFYSLMQSWVRGQNESTDEGQTQSIGGEELMKYLMKRFKMNKSKAIATMKKHKMDLSFLKKESVNEEIEPAGNMAKIAKIVRDSQAAKLGGVMIDMQSANLLMKIYNAVSDKDKEKMNKLNPKVLTRVIEKLWSRVKLKLPI